MRNGNESGKLELTSEQDKRGTTSSLLESAMSNNSIAILIIIISITIIIETIN